MDLDAVETANNFLMDEKEYWAYLNRQSAVRDYNSAINGARNEGLAEGQNQILRLVDELSKSGRFDEISKLNSDPALVENLFNEFHIE